MTDHFTVVLTDEQLDQLAARVARLLKNGDGAHAPSAPDTLLDAKAVAVRMGVSVRWVYGHDLPFVVRLPNSRAVRFSGHGLSAWLAKRMGR